jgi:hypothetical protein
MQTLEFKQIKGDMQVLYQKKNEIFATRVISTSLGHPSIHTIRLDGGFVLMYDTNNILNNRLYADNAVNRTELLLESETILTDLNTE